MWFISTLSSLPAMVAGFAVFALIGAQARARLAANGDVRNLAALPRAHGLNGALSVLVPASATFVGLSLVKLIGPRLGGAVLPDGSVFWSVLIVAMIGCGIAITRTTARFRARAASEAWIKSLLVVASTVAILTTIGIVMSMLFEAINFFRQYGWQDLDANQRVHSETPATGWMAPNHI